MLPPVPDCIPKNYFLKQTQTFSQGLLLLVKQQNIPGASGCLALSSVLKKPHFVGLLIEHDRRTQAVERACGRHTSHFLQEPAWTAGQRRTWELAALSWQETIPANVFCPAESWQKNLPSQMPSSYIVFCVLGWLCADSPCYLGALTLPQLSRGCSQVPKRLSGSSLPLSFSLFLSFVGTFS